MILIYILIGVAIGYYWRGTMISNNTGDSRKEENDEISNLEKMTREETNQEIDTKILDLLNENGKITNNDVEELLRVADSTATKYLQRLEDRGKIKQVGVTGSGVYYIK